ncbi:MAG: hypothetical protein AAFY71_04870 [Bacteroidota bacterium]
MKLYLNYLYTSLVLLGVLLMPATHFAQDAALNKMYSAISKANKVAFEFKSLERMDNGNSKKMAERHMEVDMSSSPLKIEIKLFKPNKGTKVVYDPNYKRSYAKVYVNLGIASLPTDHYLHGSTLMNDAHHPVTATGFKAVRDIFKGAQAKARSEGRYNTVFADKGTVTFEGKSCHKVEAYDANYTFEDYKVSAGESVLSIAKKKNLSAYKIMTINPNIRKVTDKLDGKTIKLPSSYAKYAVIYIDNSNNLPYMAEVHDEKGLFEKYYFYKVKVK